MRDSFDDLVFAAQEARDRVQQELRIVGDEVSILFEYKEDIDAFVHVAHLRGLWFNRSEEEQTPTRREGQISTNTSSYRTTYEFVWPGLDDDKWRIEAMHVKSSSPSPLHREHMQAFGMTSVAHVSYKLEAMEEYEEELVRLRTIGLPLLKEYTNSYGQFAYHGCGRHVRPPVMIKPRVNTRDNLRDGSQA